MQKEMKQVMVESIQLLQVDSPICHKNLTLVPVKGEAKALDYILSSTAIQEGTLTVKEIDQSGAVNSLLVENKGNRRVLLLDGEELIGAKQNRILNTTILIEANTKQKIPVSCVEQGRWRHVSTKFSSGMYSPPQMRLNKVRAVSRNYAECGQAISDQSEVWQDVKCLVEELDAHSPTGAMKDAFDQRKEGLNSYVKALPYPENTRGIAAAISGRFVSIDVLDQPDKFKEIWDRLVTGYAIDAMRRKNDEGKPFTGISAKFFLDSISDCEASVFNSAGLGKELRFESDQIVGQALVVEDCLVHMSVFPNTQQGQNMASTGRRIMPPSFHKRSR